MVDANIEIKNEREIELKYRRSKDNLVINQDLKSIVPSLNLSIIG